MRGFGIGMLAALLAGSAAAQTAPTVVAGADMQALRTRLMAEARSAANGTASARVETGAMHNTNMLVRVKDGPVEEHRDWGDELILREGQIDLVLGGAIDGRRQTGDGEYSGTGITGGTVTRMKAGDIAYIPPGTPHWARIVGTTPVVSMVYKVK